MAGPANIADMTVADWRMERDEGLRYRRQFGKERGWGENERLFYNTDYDTDLDGSNIIYSVGDTLLSELSVPDPYIKVRPTRADSLAYAPVLESVHNTLIEDLGIKAEADDAILHAYLYGVGWLKVGYDSEWGWSPEQVVNEQLNTTLTQISRKGRIEFKSTVRPGMPWVSSVMPHDIVVPWGTRRVDDAPWIMHRVVRHVDDIKMDPKYSKKSRLKGSMSMQDYVRSYDNPIQGDRLGHQHEKSATVGMTSPNVTKHHEFVELWEVHDKRTGRIKVFVDTQDEMLRDDVNQLARGGLPFVSLSFVPGSRAIWVTSQAEYLRVKQAEISDIAVQSTKHRRIEVLKALVLEDAMEDSEIAKLTSPDVGAIAKVKNAQGGDLSKVIQFLTPSHNPQLYLEAERVRNEARETIGFSQNTTGGFQGKTHISVAETEQVALGGAKRESKSQAQLSKMYQNLFKRITPIITEQWKAPRLVQVLGEDGAQIWTEFVGQQLRGAYSYKVNMITQADRRQLMFGALQLYGQLSGAPGVDPVQLGNFLTAEVNDPSFNRIFKRGGGG